MTSLKDIQKFVGVPADNVLGPQTLAAIARALGMAGGMTVSKAGLDLIKSFEGLRLDAYPDPGSGGDPWTIGYGATGPGIHKGVRWTEAQANDRLADDVSRFADGVASLIGDAPTTQAQFSAMVSLAYNVGIGNFGSSTLLKKHKAGKFQEAANEFSKWSFAAGKKLPGLVRRREAEAKMYRGGQ